MLGDLPLPGSNLDLRARVTPCDLCTLERHGLLGRLADVLDYAAPVAFGAAAWLAACRMTRLLSWLKPTDDPFLELDPIA